MKTKVIRKRILTAMVLAALCQGSVYAESYILNTGENSTVAGDANGNLTAEEIYVPFGASLNVTASGDITLEQQTRRGAMFADRGTITVGASDSLFHSFVSKGEILAESGGTIGIYGKTIEINREDNGSAITAIERNSVTTAITVGTTGTTSIVTDGEVLATGDLAQVTLTANTITMNYNPNPPNDSTIAGGEDNTAMADEGGSLVISAVYDENVAGSGVLTISGPAGAVDKNSQVTLSGRTITINHDDLQDTEEIVNGQVWEKEDRNLYADNGANVQVGTDATETVTINGQASASGVGVNNQQDSSPVQASLSIKGKQIYGGELEASDSGLVTIGDAATEKVVFTGSVVSTGLADKAYRTDVDTADVAVTGVTASSITLDGKALTLGTEGADTAVKASDQGILSIGTLVPSDSIEIRSAVTAESSGQVTIGSAAARTVSVSGLAEATGTDSTLTVDGENLTFSSGARAADAGTVTVGSTSTQTVTGNLTAEGTDSTLTAVSSGTYSGNAAASQGGSLTLTANQASGNVTASNAGTARVTAGTFQGDLTAEGTDSTLTATIENAFDGLSTVDADGTLDILLQDGARWNLTNSSTATNLTAGNAMVNLADGTLGQTLSISDHYEGEGGMLRLDADGSTNTGNDRVYVKGTHTGTTQLYLNNTNPLSGWSGAVGTVLVSVGDEQGSFQSETTTEAALNYYSLRLASRTDDVTEGYGTDWYLQSFEKAATDETTGHHTTIVRDLAAVNGSNYLLWRSDMDTLFRRIGEVHGYAPYEGDDGLWVRARGTKFSRDGEFSVSTRYNQYEIGYDWLAQRNEKDVHLAGIGFAYLDGDATYHMGKGDVKGYTLGLYDTHVWDDGQHLDLVLKGQRLFNDFHYHALGTYGSGTAAATGFSLGAEYGYKMKDARSGWFAEPQGQIALGWLQNSAYTDSNGVHVDGDTVRTALGRIGARAGYEGPKFQAFVKANWYHDFGGNSTLTFTTADDALRIHEDYGDTWFEYGLGIAWNLNRTTQLYADIDRGDGSSYDKDWSWDIGLRWNF